MLKPTDMPTASAAIETLDTLTARVAEHHRRLCEDAEYVKSRWEGLRRVGGCRDDHAKDLLRTLRPTLENLHRFTGRCLEQLATLQNNPYGEE